MEAQGYKNLLLINQSVRELYRAMTPHRIGIYSDNFVLGGSWDDTLGDNFVLVGTNDPRFGANRLAKRIVSHYRLAGTTVMVNFSDNLKTPGNVELSSSNDFTIQIQSQHRDSLKNVAAILAHEVAHIFLHRNGIRFADEFKDEVLADKTASYLGFGAIILNAASQNSYRRNNVVHTDTNYFGYLSLDEIGYIVAKREVAFEHDSISMIDSEVSRYSLRNGRIRLQNELNNRPFVARPWHQRIYHSLFGSSESHLIRQIMFACPRCSQRLRIPETYRKISVHCPTCDSRFSCYS